MNRDNVQWRSLRADVPEEPGHWAHNLTTEYLIKYIVDEPIPYMALVKFLIKPRYYDYASQLQDRSGRIDLLSVCVLLKKLYLDGKIIYVKNAEGTGSACVEAIIDSFLADYDAHRHAAWAHQAIDEMKEKLEIWIYKEHCTQAGKRCQNKDMIECESGDITRYAGPREGFLHAAREMRVMAKKIDAGNRYTLQIAKTLEEEANS